MTKAGAGEIVAPLGGTVLSVSVQEGQQIKEGDVVLIFEAMKMENEVVSPYSGTVKKVHVAKGAVLEVGQVLVTVG